MGASKPLLPLGSMTAIERLIRSVSRADVDEVIVVTGHDEHKLGPVLDRIPVRQAYNPGYDSGMFSSVRAGVRASLDETSRAFFVLPADYPLIGPRALDRLILAFEEGGHGILHPSCCGVRGHPPLVSHRYAEALLKADGEQSLRDFLLEYTEDEVEVEIDELSILMDMDAADDYARLSQFAGYIDTAIPEGVSAPRAAPSLSTEDALYLLSLLEVSDQLLRHCRTVALVGETLAHALKPHVPSLDQDLVRTAGLLHDMAKNTPKHAIVAQNLLSNLGLSRLGQVVGAHMILSPGQLDTPSLTEEQLIYLADKLVIEDELAGIEERGARALRRRGPDPVGAEGVRTRMRAAHIVRERVETVLQRPLEEVLPRETRLST